MLIFWWVNSSSLCLHCYRNESFADCKNDNLCGKKELFYEGGIYLILLVYNTKQRLMMALLWVYKIAKKSFDSFVRFITILLAGCGKVSLKFHPYSPTSEPLSLGCHCRQQGCSSHAVNSGLCWLCRSPLRDFWTWQSCTTLVSRSPPDTFKDSPCNLHAEQKEAAKSNGTLKATALPKNDFFYIWHVAYTVFKNSHKCLIWIFGLSNASKCSHSMNVMAFKLIFWLLIIKHRFDNLLESIYASFRMLSPSKSISSFKLNAFPNMSCFAPKKT